MKVSICKNPECESDGLPFITAQRLDKCPVCSWPIPRIVKDVKDTKDVKKPSVIVAHKNLAPVDDKPSDNIIAEFVAIKNEIHLCYNMLYGFLSKNNDLLKSKDLNSKQLCDFGFLCRETEKIFDELRKECKVRMEKAGAIIAYRLTQKSLTDPDAAGRVVGELATGTPSCKMQAALPKKFSDEYYQLTDYFEIPRHRAEEGVFKLDWKAVTEFLTEQMERGRPIPEGFGQQYPKYIVSYRRKNL